MASFPSEATVPSKSAIPEIPEAGSINPDAARFIFSTVTLALSGVRAALLGSMGPALPSSFRLPPAGGCADISKGNEEVNEKSVTLIVTLSYERGFCDDPARDRVRRPSLTISLATDKLGLLEAAGAAGCGLGLLGAAELAGGAADALLPPRLEKFHFSPSADFTRLISGWFRVRWVTCSVFVKISGISSTPTLRDFAWTNGDLLKAGSSAMEMSSAATLPVNSESERFPTLTGRPSAAVRSDSILGRKELASMKKGIAITMTMITATTMAAIFKLRFMIPTSCRNGIGWSCFRWDL